MYEGSDLIKIGASGKIEKYVFVFKIVPAISERVCPY